MASSRKREGDGDDRSNKQKRRNPTDLHDYFKVDETDDGEIKVMTNTDKFISLSVKSSNTIGEIKEKIKAKQHIPVDQKELVFGGTVLDDINTLANLRIVKDSTLTLAPKLTALISIDIKNLEGLTLGSLKVNPSGTIGDVKAKLGSIGQVLTFNDIVLEDNRTLADFNIINGSTLTRIGKSEGKMEIFVNTFTGKTISLLVNPTHTIADVKLEIWRKECIPVNEQALIFNEMVLGDTCTLFDFYVNKNSTLKVMCKSTGFIKIHIKAHDGETNTLKVKSSDTIHNLKAKIEDKMHIPHDEQALIFNEMVLDNTDTLAYYNINSHSTLTLVCISKGLMCIFIKFQSGETIDLQVKPSYTIGYIKAKILDKLHIPHDEQELIFNEMILHNTDTLADCNITNESTLTSISTGFMRIFIKTGDGETATMKVKPSDTIQKVKSNFLGVGAYHPCHKSLSFNGRKLEDSLTLADYHIHNGSIVQCY